MESKEPRKEYSEKESYTIEKMFSEYGNSSSQDHFGGAESDGIQEDNQTTGSGYSEEERNREDSTNDDTDELDPGYYEDKENSKKKSEDTDYNRNESSDETEGVEPNR